MFSDLQYFQTASVLASCFSGVTHWVRSSARTSVHRATVVNKAELFLYQTPEASTESHYFALPKNTAMKFYHCLLLRGICILYSGSGILLAQKVVLLFPLILQSHGKSYIFHNVIGLSILNESFIYNKPNQTKPLICL